MVQVQTRRGDVPIGSNRIQQNRFMHAGTDTIYRSPANPESLIDKTVNITFRHTLGYLNYFILFESFLYFYSRDARSKDLPKMFQVELLNGKGSVYARINIKDPIIDGIDMLDFDYTQPHIPCWRNPLSSRWHWEWCLSKWPHESNQWGCPLSAEYPV